MLLITSYGLSYDCKETLQVCKVVNFLRENILTIFAALFAEN